MRTVILILVLISLFTGCATSRPKTPEDPNLTTDRKVCRSKAGLNQAGRNDPGAYRAQARYNLCMERRGRTPE